jgi:para-nitrobenzyl esterase
VRIRRFRLAAGAAVLAAALAAAGLPAVALAHDGPPEARTATGVVRGSTASGVDSFLGVPYAKPPVGALRWRAPQPAVPWTGVRDATRYGNRCPATASTNGPRSETEDCLFLNVQRPQGTKPGQHLPVYFWIHGGGLENGSSNQHDGTLITQLTGVIVVTINYRLGVFGFLAHPALTAEAGQSGNYGLMDQQAALRWVHDNIASFGGDPRQVTIGGESAGGWSVCAHLSAPASRGLFARAIMESGSCYSQTESQAETAGSAVAQSVGCTNPATAAACLRAVPTGTLLDHGPSGVAFVRNVPELPVDPDTAIRTGAFAHVPVLIGANRDEGRTFAQGAIGLTETQYDAFVAGAFPTNSAAVLARYPWPSNADQFTPAYLIGAIETDSGLLAGIGGCTNRSLTQSLAAYTKTYAYEFDHRTGPGLSPQPAGYIWGAGHAAELAYLWPSFDNGTPIAPTFNAAERELAANMVHYWGSFVRGEAPKAPRSATWTTYNKRAASISLRAGGDSTMIGDATIIAEHQCDFWAVS